MVLVHVGNCFLMYDVPKWESGEETETKFVYLFPKTCTLGNLLVSRFPPKVFDSVRCVYLLHLVFILVFVCVCVCVCVCGVFMYVFMYRIYAEQLGRLIPFHVMAWSMERTPADLS